MFIITNTYRNFTKIYLRIAIFPLSNKTKPDRLNEVLAFLQIAKCTFLSLSYPLQYLVLSRFIQPAQPHFDGTSPSPSSHIFYLWNLPASMSGIKSPMHSTIGRWIIFLLPSVVLDPNKASKRSLGEWWSYLFGVSKACKYSPTHCLTAIIVVDFMLIVDTA